VLEGVGSDHWVLPVDGDEPVILEVESTARWSDAAARITVEEDPVPVTVDGQDVYRGETVDVDRQIELRAGEHVFHVRPGGDTGDANTGGWAP
jgi:hypothetical protein